MGTDVPGMRNVSGLTRAFMSAEFTADRKNARDIWREKIDMTKDEYCLD